jgi:HTH-type transcriptional regulator, cell division transcriptional repressor
MNMLVTRLNQLLKEKDLNKVDLARIAGVSPQSVNGWYKRGAISKQSAMKISAALNVPLAWLLGEGGEASSGLSDEEQQLLALFRQFPPTERRNMVAAFEMRLQELRDYYSRYASPEQKS